MLTSSIAHRKSRADKGRSSAPIAKPYCQCWNRHAPVPWKNLGSSCTCGEDNDVSEWRWEKPHESAPSWVVISEDKKQVTFHPFYSSGTAAIRGDSPLLHNHHYYWEVKMLTDTYGTDIMVGIGTNKVNISENLFQFKSLLGQDAESYGLSYTGAVRHNATIAKDSVGFCRGAIIGVRVDMWRGTLEFYINRKPQGVSFYNLRRHENLFPMMCSTAAQSSMRLIYAASWRASLLVDAAKTLAASVKEHARVRVPPGLWYRLKNQFWLTLPTEGCIEDDDEKDDMDIEPVPISESMLGEIFPNQYMNGFYVDNVEPDYRIVVWQ